jgi:Insertion element 4 transposase N-terminal
MANRAEILKQKFYNSVALPFEQVLPEGLIQRLLDEQGVKYRQTLYTPIVVIWSWVCQVLDEDKSLSNAVNRVMAWVAAAQACIPSADTGAYSKARKRLPLAVLQSLLSQTANALTSQIKPEQQWCGRRVKAYDGTSVLMSDTAANQDVYPQHSNQKVGVWLPVSQSRRLVLWHHGGCAGSGSRSLSHQ